MREEEPNVSKDIKAALFAPTAGICWPFGLALAFAENAVINGAEVIRDCKVTDIVVEDGAVKAVETDQGTIETKYVINAAGVHADDISRLAGDDSFTIKPRRANIFSSTKRLKKTWSTHRFSRRRLRWARHPGLCDDARQRFRRA